MNKTLLHSLFLAVLISVSACSAKMPLDDNKFTTGSDQGLGVLVVTTQNDHSSPALTPTVIQLKSIDGKVKKDYAFPKPVRELGEKGYQFVASMQLPAGDYYVTAFNGHTDLHFGSVLPTRGQFNPEVNFPVSLKGGQYSYLGHLTARLIEKTSDNEERAGPVLPLLDQAATGMSDGTFKFTIQDKFSTDLPLIQEAYPAMTGVSFTRNLLALDSSGVPKTPPTYAQPTTNETTVTKKATEPEEIVAKATSDNCSTAQILKMKEMGMSDTQVKAACPG